MKSRCGCDESLRSGSLKGVNFFICTNCSYLQWETSAGLSLIESLIELEFSGFLESGRAILMSDLVNAVETHLQSFSTGSFPIKIDFRRLGFAAAGQIPGGKWSLALDPDATLSAKCATLADVWLYHRDDEVYKTLIAYADFGLPLAVAINSGMVETTKAAESFVSDTYRHLLALPTPDRRLVDSVRIPIIDDITSWDIRAAEYEEEEEMFALVAERLHEYTTEEILNTTIEDMFGEMMEYMQTDTAKELKRHFSTFRLPDTSVEVRVSEVDLRDPLQLSSARVIEPFIERG